jgi:hypothetical protein
VPYSLCWKPNCMFVLTCWWAVQIATLSWIVPVNPDASLVRICKMESVISYWNWQQNPIITLIWTYGVLLEVRNWKERCYARNLVATSSHIWTLSLLLFQGSASALTSLIQSPYFTIGLCSCVPNSNQVHSLLLVIVKLCPWDFARNSAIAFATTWILALLFV